MPTSSSDTSTQNKALVFTELSSKTQRQVIVNLMTKSPGVLCKVIYFLKGKVTGKDRGKKERKRFFHLLVHAPHASKHPELSQTETRNQEFAPRYQEPKYFDQHLLLLR